MIFQSLILSLRRLFLPLHGFFALRRHIHPLNNASVHQCVGGGLSRSFPKQAVIGNASARDHALRRGFTWRRIAAELQLRLFDHHCYYPCGFLTRKGIFWRVSCVHSALVLWDADYSLRYPGKRVWLRPGKKYLFGRVKQEGGKQSLLHCILQCMEVMR